MWVAIATALKIAWILIRYYTEPQKARMRAIARLGKDLESGHYDFYRAVDENDADGIAVMLDDMLDGM